MDRLLYRTELAGIWLSLCLDFLLIFKNHHILSILVEQVKMSYSGPSLAPFEPRRQPDSVRLPSVKLLINPNTGPRSPIDPKEAQSLLALAEDRSDNQSNNQSYPRK